MDNLTQRIETSVDKGKKFAEDAIKSFCPLLYDKFIYTDGPGDGGIDSFCIDEGDSGIYISINQSKYGSSFTGKDTILGETGKLRVTLLDPKFTGNYGSHIKTREALRSGKNVYLTYIFATSRSLTPEEREILESEMDLLKKTLGFFDITLVVLSEKDIIAGLEFSSFPVTFNLEGSMFIDPQEKHLTGVIKVIDLYLLVRQVNDTFKDKDTMFSRNVRSYLGSRARVNKKIRETLDKGKGDFILLNKGVTISTPYPLEKLGAGRFNIISPSIIDGAQTTNTILETIDLQIKKYGEDKIPALNEQVKIEVMVIDDATKEKEITIARNTSTPVNKAALKASKGKEIYRELRDKLVKAWGEDYSFNIKGQSVDGKPGADEIMSTAGCILGLPGEATTPTNLMPDEDNPGSFGYQLSQKMLSEMGLSKLSSYIANNLSGRLKNWVFHGLKKTDATNKCGRIFTLMLIISRLITLYGKGKGKISGEYSGKISSTPGLETVVSPELADISIKLLSTKETQDAIFSMTDKFWGTYAIDPTMVESNLRKDYRDRFDTPKNVLPKDETIMRTISGKCCGQLHSMIAFRVEDIVEASQEIKSKIWEVINKN